jgi:hypothetical protein
MRRRTLVKDEETLILLLYTQPLYRPAVLESNDRSDLRGRRKSKRYFKSSNADLPTGNNNKKATVVPRMITPLAAMVSIVLLRTTIERNAMQARKAASEANTKGAR